MAKNRKNIKMKSAESSFFYYTEKNPTTADKTASTVVVPGPTNTETTKVIEKVVPDKGTSDESKQ